MIDGDALLEKMKHRREYVGRLSDPVCLVEDAPTVDAIPVAWLNRLSDLAETSNRMLYHSIHVVMFEWNRWKEMFGVKTVDTVPVVRCANCRYYNTACCGDGFGWCERNGHGSSDDLYCADGEKRENNP